MTQTFAIGGAVIIGVTAAMFNAPMAHYIKEQPVAQDVIQVPDQWIPLSADVTVFHPGRRSTVGHFYRAADGSTRLETGPDNGEVAVIEIKNIVESKYYLKTPHSGWVRGPMILPPDGYRPRNVKATMPSLTKYGFKLALRQGQDGSVQAMEGFTAYQHTDSNGTITFHVPELNYFPVITQFASGNRAVYSNIIIGDPPISLFQGPVGEPISDTTKPGGFVWSQ